MSPEDIYCRGIHEATTGIGCDSEKLVRIIAGL